MNSIAIFEISPGNYFEVCIPDFKNKYNYYYEPTGQLDLFDEVSISLNNNTNNYLIATDILQAILGELQGAIKKINVLPSEIRVGELGKLYNKNMISDDFESIDFADFWMLSGIKTQVWVYESNGQKYIEVSDTFPNLFSDNMENDERVIRDSLDNYKPLLLETINDTTIHAWLKKCDFILQGAEEHHKKAHKES